MVRWIRSNRLISGLTRSLRLFLRWILVWLSYLLRRSGRWFQVTRRTLSWMIHPRNPNNLFVVGMEASDHAPENLPVDGAPDIAGEGGQGALLWASQSAAGAQETEFKTSSLSLWRGERKLTAEEATTASSAVNRRFAYLDVLSSQVRRLTVAQIDELEALIQRLARKWLDVDETFQSLPRRNRLDVGRTLRHNIPRYAGKILSFQWATKERPVPQLAKPARILVIGDVSHSMVHYVSVLLFFFHKLNFRFVVDSWVFSEQATHSTPYLNGLGSFEEKVQRLIAGAKSWNAGTRFGSALEEIAAHALVDENTYVIIATDGKVSLQPDETIRIELHMKELRRRAKQVVFVTPSTEFSDGVGGKIKPERLGSFKYDFVEIPIYSVGPPLWYGTLGEYADRLYLVRTVQDLIDMTEDLILATR